RVDEAREPSVQRLAGEFQETFKKLVRETAAQNRCGPRHRLAFGEAVKAGQERGMEADRQSGQQRAQRARLLRLQGKPGLNKDLGQFLYEKRYAARTLNDIAGNRCRQIPAFGDEKNEGSGFWGRQGSQRYC